MIKVVHIGPSRFTVAQTPGLRDGDEQVYGITRHDTCEILIDSTLCPQAKYQTLWHEVVHVIMTQAGHEGEHDETMVSALSYGIVDVLQRNPKLRKGKG